MWTATAIKLKYKNHNLEFFFQNRIALPSSNIIFNTFNNVIFILADSNEYLKLQRADIGSKAILHHVNKTVQEYENHQRLVDLQRRLDKRQIESSNNPAIQEYKVTHTRTQTSTNTDKHTHTDKRTDTGKSSLFLHNYWIDWFSDSF